MRNQLIGSSRENNISLLGAQGPTVFLHGGNFLGKTLKADAPEFEFYQLLSQRKTAEVFNSMVYYIQKEDDLSVKTLLIAYLRGYLNAYSLERNIQPYIFYFSGYERTSTLVNDQFLKRVFLETQLDVLYEQSIREKTPLKNLLPVNKSSIKEISKMFYHVALDVFSLPNITKKSFLKSFYRMRRKLKFLGSPKYSIKKIVTKLFPSSYINVLARGQKVEKTDTYDFLNLRKQEWRHPTTGFPINLSFLELINEVRGETPFLNSITKRVEQQKTVEQEIRSFCMGINFFGIKEETEPIFFKPIFKE